MATYIWVNGQGWVPEDAYYATKYAERTNRSDLPAPTVRSDIAEYRSPVDGKLITSRSQRRDDLRAHGCVEWEPGIRQDCTKAGKRDPNWSKKHKKPMKDGRVQW